MIVAGQLCNVESWKEDEVACSIDFNVAVAGNLVAVIRDESWDSAAWWDLVNDMPVPLDGTSWCPDPCPLEPVVTEVLCDAWPWPTSAETCLGSTDYKDINIEVRRGHMTQA